MGVEGNRTPGNFLHIPFKVPSVRELSFSFYTGGSAGKIPVGQKNFEISHLWFINYWGNLKV